MKMRISVVAAVSAAILVVTGPAGAQPVAGRDVVLQAVEAMGGRERIESVGSLRMTGFGQYLSQNGGASPSPEARSPDKWQAANAIERIWDLDSGLSRTSDRRGNLFPFAGASGHSYALSTRTEGGIGALDHPLPAVRAALARGTRFGPVTTEGGTLVVELTLDSGQALWLGVDAATSLPAFVRSVEPSTTLGDVIQTVWFTGYLPFDGVELPVGITTSIDWRDKTIASLHIDSYVVDPPDFEPLQSGPGRAAGEAPQAIATPLARGVWDVRYGGNGGAVIEFEDHLTMFEAYASEAATFARIDLANRLVPGKEVTELIVSHHHFDHSGGLRAAVARGLTVIARKGNEELFREMVARPAPNFPDALARNPRPLRFVPVDEHLVLEDSTMRVDVYRAVGHLHMAEAVVAYIPEHRMFLEGDFSTWNWDYHWWGDAYLDTVERYGLDPAINVPVHGRVTTFAETIQGIEEQVGRARAFCAANADVGIHMAGCPNRYSRD